MEDSVVTRTTKELKPARAAPIEEAKPKLKLMITKPLPLHESKMIVVLKMRPEALKQTLAKIEAKSNAEAGSESSQITQSTEEHDATVIATKRRRGRPKGSVKSSSDEEGKKPIVNNKSNTGGQAPARKRGRPKSPTTVEKQKSGEPRKRGRPKSPPKPEEKQKSKKAKSENAKALKVTFAGEAWEGVDLPASRKENRKRKREEVDDSKRSKSDVAPAKTQKAPKTARSTKTEDTTDNESNLPTVDDLQRRAEKIELLQAELEQKHSRRLFSSHTLLVELAELRVKSAQAKEETLALRARLGLLQCGLNTEAPQERKTNWIIAELEIREDLIATLSAMVDSTSKTKEEIEEDIQKLKKKEKRDIVGFGDANRILRRQIQKYEAKLEEQPEAAEKVHERERKEKRQAAMAKKKMEDSVDV